MAVLFCRTDSDEEIVPDYWHVPEYGRCLISVTRLHNVRM
jgi:hypothetical protein